MKTYLIIIFFSYLFVVFFGYYLKALSLRHLKKFGATVPHEFEGYIDSTLLKKTSDYTIESSRFSFIESVFDNIILIIFLFGGLLDTYNSWIISLNRGFILSGLIFFFILIYAETIISIPFSLYSTFKIENKYGFNTQTLRLWITDFLKSILISTILTGVMISIGLWLVNTSPAYWWLWVWGFFFILSLFIMYISPYVIEPLFNKFTPIDDKALEDKIRALAEKAGIKVSRIFKMDASKRSKHTNAYFTGIGKVKRIILYDTLLAKMEPDEIIAVLAHEIGHWKKKHVLKLIVLSEVMAFVGLYIAFQVLQHDFLSMVFSIETDSFFAKTVILGFLTSIINFIFTPLFNYLSRYHEQQADRFAYEITKDPAAMVKTLIKLSKDNLSNLHPHPLYAAFYYSHPPVVQRIKEIKGMGS